MSKGILLFARNNSHVDYVKQAYFLAKQAKTHLNLPTSIVTDSIFYLECTFPDAKKVFDNIIKIVWDEKDLTDSTTLSKSEDHCIRTYFDGAMSKRRLQFKNETRTLAYDVSPYDETLLIDTDILIINDLYKHCFTQDNDFLIYDTAYDLANFRDYSEFKYLSDCSVKFYWATVVFFRKTKINKIFFNLLQHIQENWNHYRSIFQIYSSIYRNDHAFSIAIHIMNGYTAGNFSYPMPGKLFYTTDKDICWNINIKNKEILFLVEKENYHGEYTPIMWKDHNIHIMNKFSYNRCLCEILDGK